MTDVVIERLSKRFGSVIAVDDLSMTARAGRVTGFLGPNGSGKTTTIRILLGLTAETTGSATIGGRRYREIPRPARLVGAVLGTDSFHPARRAHDHLRVVAAMNGIGRSRVDEVLDQVGLTEAAGRRVKGYSLGMRQRLALATALLPEPGVLVLDEPANGLDPDGIRWLRSLLRQLAEEGRTILVSSHALAEVARTADDVAVISRGRLVVQGELNELLDAQAGEFVVRTPRAAYLAAALAHHGADARVSGDTVVVDPLARDLVVRVAAEHSVPVTVVEDRNRSLEDAFFDLVAPDNSADDPSGRTERQYR